MQQALPVGENLLRRGLLDNACCPRCGELETTDHLFLHCEYATKVWRLLPFKTPSGSSAFSDFQTALRASPNLICLPPTGVGTGPMFPWFCWALWSARNHLIFENRTFSPEESAIKAIKDAREWQEAQQEEKKQSNLSARKTPCPSLSPMDHDTIVVPSDASCHQSSKQAELGGVFFNHLGAEISRCVSTESFVSSPLMAEALAILAVLSKALAMGITNVIIKSDAKELLRIIREKEQNIELYGILADIHQACSLLSSADFYFIPRNENVVADSAAKNAITMASSSSISTVYPV